MFARIPCCTGSSFFLISLPLCIPHCDSAAAESCLNGAQLQYRAHRQQSCNRLAAVIDETWLDAYFLLTDKNLSAQRCLSASWHCNFHACTYVHSHLTIGTMSVVGAQFCPRLWGPEQTMVVDEQGKLDQIRLHTRSVSQTEHA